MVAIAVMVLRTDRSRPHASVPHAGGAGWSAPLAIARLHAACSSACRWTRIALFVGWAVIGLVVYFALQPHAAAMSAAASIEVHEHEAYEELEPPVPGTH